MHVWIQVLVVWGVLTASLAQNNGLIMNGVVDTLLRRADVHLRPFWAKIDLPDFTVMKTVRVAFIRVTSRLDASTGWISPGAVHRFEDATFQVKDESTIIVDFTTGVDELQFSYKYTTKVGVVRGVKGHITGTVGPTALRVRLSVTPRKKECQAKVESVDLSKFGEVTLHATGMKYLNALFTKLVNHYFQEWKGDMREKIVAEARKMLGTIYDCNSYLPEILQPCDSCVPYGHTARNVTSWSN